jgi:hypothetical protein
MNLHIDPSSSPLKGTGRPISAILVAYHAVANIYLWTCESLKKGIVDEYFVKNLEELPSKLQVLDNALASTRALTSLGHLLWEPLRERVLDMSR